MIALGAGIRDRLDRERSMGSVLLVGVALVPAGVTAVCIAAFSVNTLWLEEWDYVVWFQKLANHELSLGDLFRQHNEYRQFFPNAIFVLLGLAGKGDMRLGMLVSFLLACLVSLNVHRLARVWADAMPVQAAAAPLAANLLIFSPIQYENWLQGQQLIYFVPIACLTACVLLAYSPKLGTATRFALCALLCTIATFSSANGILCWLLVLPALVRPLSADGVRAAKWWIAAWAAALALNLGVYLHGYARPAQHPPLTLALAEPWSTARYFLVLLGASLGVDRPRLAAPLGVIFLVAFAAVCLDWWRRRRDNRHSAPTVAWLIIGGYSVATALLIATARVGLGADTALLSRYTTFTLYLPLSLVFLIPLFIDGRARSASPGPSDVRPFRPAAALAVVLVVAHVPLYLLGIEHMSRWHARALATKACVLLVNVVEDDCERLIPYHDVARVRQRADMLERLGFLEGAIVRSDNVRDISVVDGMTGTIYGSFDRLIDLGGDQYVAEGNAFLPHRREPAHLVLLAYRDAGDRERLFAVSRVARGIDLTSAPFTHSGQQPGRWRKSFMGRGLPGGSVRVSAWAFDAYTGRAYELKGTRALDNSARAGEQ